MTWATAADEFLYRLFDASVLYPATVRDILLQLAVTNLFRAKWTADIHEEWIRSRLRDQPQRDRAALERTRDLMDTAVRDCLVTGYQSGKLVLETRCFLVEV